MGALEENNTVPGGNSFAEHDLKPFSDRFRFPRWMNFNEYPDRSAGVNHGCLSPKLSSSFVEGVPPEETSPISAILLQHQDSGSFQREVDINS